MTHMQVEQRKLQVTKVAFHGCYCVVILTGQSQLTAYERKLSGIELVLFLKVDFRK